MIDTENVESYCRNCVSRDFVSGRGLVCKRTGSLPDFEEECEHYEMDEQLVAVAPDTGVETVEENREAEEENLPLAIAGGVVACLIGAAVWALISVATGYQIGYMAIGIGFIVGMAMRLGSGTRPLFGYVGAALALLSCLLGDYFSIIGFLAEEVEMPYWETFASISVEAMVEALIENMMSVTLLFYGIAVYEAYKLSFSAENEAEEGEI